MSEAIIAPVLVP